MNIKAPDFRNPGCPGSQLAFKNVIKSNKSLKHTNAGLCFVSTTNLKRNEHEILKTERANGSKGRVTFLFVISIVFF